MTQKKTIRELQDELEMLLAWFESSEVDVDQAMTKFQEGQEIIGELKKRLDEAELVITKLKTSKK